MTRSRQRSTRPAAPAVPADPSLLETDLTEWAGPRIAQTGRKDALLGRVEMLRLSLDGKTVEARVRGNRPLPYRVAIEAAESAPAACCSCSGQGAGACRHAIAVLEALRFPRAAVERPATRPRRGPARRGGGAGRIIQHAPAAPGFVVIGESERTQTREERLRAARDDELSVRRQRSHRDRVRVVSKEGEAPRLEVVPRHGESHHVTLRGSGELQPACTCEDFADNELRSCRHVARVQRWQTRLKKSERPEPGPYVSLWCSPREWIDRVPQPLREIRVDARDGAARAALSRYFDAEGWLRGAPDDVSAARWARRARNTARRWATRAGLGWDQDPRVDRRIREAAAEETCAARRGRCDDEQVWNSVVARLGMQLHPYQEEGVRLLARTGRAFLADDMGLGKTLQAIVAALLLRKTSDARKTLIVCPASLKHQWSREIHRACAEHAVVVDGPRARRLEAYASWTAGFAVVNYELLLRDFEPIRQAAPQLVVLDEAQRIKNWNTKTARAVKQLTSPHAFVLTGTPLENRLGELHSLVEFLHPRALGPRWRLVPFHAVTDGRGRVIAYEGLAVLRSRLAGFFVRRERRAVVDQLPERTDNTFWTGMTPAQRRPYRRHAAQAAVLLGRRDGLSAVEIGVLFRALTGMRILCNAWAQYEWEEHRDLVTGRTAVDDVDLRQLGSPKLEEFARVIEDLLDASDEKIVVFSQWARMLRLARFAVGAALERRDLRAELFHGGLSSSARADLLDAYRTDADFRMLFSTDAGGLGLNLQHASIVVNLDVPWNPAVLEQRVGRVHRLGQRRSVQVLHFVTRGAIEERVRQVAEEKRALFDGLLVNGADQVVFDARERASFVDRMRRLIDEEDPSGAATRPRTRV